MDRKYFSVIFSLILINSCTNKPMEEPLQNEKTTVVKFDSTPVDSFSGGAISFDVARKIRMSSVTYQDSLKKVAADLELQKKAQAQKDLLKKQAEKTVAKEEKPDKPAPDDPKQ